VSDAAQQPALDFKTIFLAGDGWSVEIIDQTRLPHDYVTVSLRSLDDAGRAIRDMLVRGAPLIGGTAAYGVALAMKEDPGDAMLARACRDLLETRPTAVNLRWALDDMRNRLQTVPEQDRVEAAYARAAEIVREDAALCDGMGAHGLAVIQEIARSKPAGEPVKILTHCNAGALATCGSGTATAPIYRAHADGVPVHVWVDETRPRNQGAALTTWELARAGVSHALIADNTGGHLMQHGMVDLCIVGTDRTTASGDVCNKIGTYLKALAAKDNDVPFYVALPSTTIDWTLTDGLAGVPIEQRAAEEVTDVTGLAADGTLKTVTVPPVGTPVANYAFDVTPGRLVTGLITERGIAEASASGLAALFPEHAQGT